MDLSVVTDLWGIVKPIIVDVIGIVKAEPLMVALIIALPLIGLGVGLFSRIKNA